MLIFLTIFQYLISAIVDLADKFLISTRKIHPLNYTFYTVVTGVVLCVIWPWVYVHQTIGNIGWDMLSGAIFSLAMYVFFKALSEGEVTRVITFIFALVPVFDILIGLVTGRNSLRLHEIAALCLLIPGAMLIVYKRKNFLGKHVTLKIFSAFLFSFYYSIWQFAGQHGPVLNNLLWNRVGAALALLLLLVIPVARKQIFRQEDIQKKGSTSVLFLLKQLVGGLNFVLLSYLFVIGKISIVSSLQGFRYVFIFLISLVLTKKYAFVLKEETDKHIIKQKWAAIALIGIGTAVLFL